NRPLWRQRPLITWRCVCGLAKTGPTSRRAIMMLHGPLSQRVPCARRSLSLQENSWRLNLEVPRSGFMQTPTLNSLWARRRTTPTSCRSDTTLCTQVPRLSLQARTALPRLARDCAEMDDCRRLRSGMVTLSAAYRMDQSQSHRLQPCHSSESQQDYHARALA